MTNARDTMLTTTMLSSLVPPKRSPPADLSSPRSTAATPGFEACNAGASPNASVAVSEAAIAKSTASVSGDVWMTKR